MKAFLLTALAALTFQVVSAQEYIDYDMTMTQKISILKLPDGDPTQVDPKTNSATLQVFNFPGQGNTVVMTLDLPEVKQLAKKQNTTVNMQYTWSGKDIHLVKAMNSGNLIYLIMNGNTPGGSLLKTRGNDGKEAWMAMILTSDGVVSDVNLGMTRLAVEEKCKELGLSKFEYLHKDGDLTVYQLKWLNKEKVQDGFGPEDYHYEMNSNKVYAKFWFNDNDRLVKWLRQ